VDPATVQFAGFFQVMLETTVILIGDKDRAAVIATLDNVLGMPGQNVAR